MPEIGVSVYDCLPGAPAPGSRRWRRCRPPTARCRPAEFGSTSTNASWTTFYLFRRVGPRLTPIFHAGIDAQTVDKSGADDRRRRSIVRFDSRMHWGAYDLLVATGGHLRRFVWNGSRYRRGPG